MYVYEQLNSGNIHLNHHQERKIYDLSPQKKFQKKISCINIKLRDLDISFAVLHQFMNSS